MSQNKFGHLESYVTAPRQAYVHCIWLCIELEAYDRSKRVSQDPDEYPTSDTDNHLITVTLETLFVTPSQWQPNGDFNPFPFTQDAPMGSTAEAEFGPFFLEDEIRYSVERIMHRVFEPVMPEGPFETREEENQWWQGLPSVPAVTGVLLRQQNYRRWNSRALAQMSARFPQLREIHYEPWREWDRHQQTVTNQGYESFLESVGGGTHPNLCKLSCVPAQCEPVRTPSPTVARQVARTSRGLHHLAASFIVEASHFFGHLERS
ncbi:hypothetical protein PG987_006692 [Apiospora arundinis]